MRVWPLGSGRESYVYNVPGYPVEHEHPSWYTIVYKDGESILPVLTDGRAHESPGLTSWSRTVPLGFNLGRQTALIDPRGGIRLC